jgi:hypothetical protein
LAGFAGAEPIDEKENFQVGIRAWIQPNSFNA